MRLLRGPLTGRIRTTMRYAEVLEVLVRFGFGSFVVETGLDKLIWRGRRLLGVRPDEEAAPLSMPVRLRLTLEALGATFIKLGQVLSTRPDLVPMEIADEFAGLQRNAPLVPIDKIQQRLRGAYGSADAVDKTFASFDQSPLAAGSVAQVHRATLRSGEAVVVKVLRPGVEKQIEPDVAILMDLARFVEARLTNLGFSPVEVVEQFAAHLERELDFTHEGRVTDRFAQQFEDDARVNFPKVYWSATNRQVLVLEEVRGVQLSSDAVEDLAPETKRAALASGAEAVFLMCLEHGFFHADPHPGNLFVQPDGSVYFIDCGMSGHLDTTTRQQLLLLVQAILKADLDRTVRLAVEIAGADPDIEIDRRFRADLWELITRFETSTLEGLDLPALLDQFFEVLRRYQVRCPSDLVFLIKALTTIQGVGQQVDPTFDVIGHVRPLMRRVGMEQLGPVSVTRRIQRALLSWSDLLAVAPDEFRRLSSRIRRGQVTVQLNHGNLEGLADAISRTGRFVAVALILSATIVGSAILIHSAGDWIGTSVFAVIGAASMLVAVGFLLVLMIDAWRRR